MHKAILFFIILGITCSIFAKSNSKVLILKADSKSNVILVAVMKDTDTEFKNTLIDALKSQYEPKYQVKKAIIGKSKDLQNQPYRVLIVMDQLKAWLAMNGQTKAIMKQTKGNNAIFYMTAGDKKWQWKEQDIHHIASASEKTHFPKAWQELKTKVDALLK